MIQTFLANHAMLAGFLSLLQVAVLPGLLFLWWRPRIGGWLLLPLSVVLSLVLNFQLAYYFTLLGIYRFESLVIAALLLFVMAIRHKHPVTLPAGTGSIPTEHRQPLVLIIAGFAVAGAALLILGTVLWARVPGVFDSWDAVVSWNRWAIDWFNGRLPVFTYGYPQLVPSAWASLYVWMGTAEVEFFAKGLMLVFPLGVIAIFADMYARFRWPAALFAIALWCVALMRVFPDVMDSGYVDVPVAFFVFLTAYLLFLGRRKVMEPSLALWLAALSAAGAVLTKQAGAIACVMLMWGIFDRRGNPTPGVQWRRAAMLAIIIFLVFTLPWFGYKFYQILVGTDPSNVNYVTSNIYAGESLLARLWRATTINAAQAMRFLGPVPLVASAMLALGIVALKTSLGRVCWLGVALPYYIVWALFFSYDLRNFMLAVPFICLGLGLGLQGLWPSTTSRSLALAPEKFFQDRSPQVRWRASAALALAGSLAAITLFFDISRDSLIKGNEQRRLESHDPALNQQLLAYAKKPGFDGKIFTTYTPVASISGLKEHFFENPESPSPSREMIMAIKESQPFCHILTMMPRHRELRYILLHTGIHPDLINAALANGSLQLIFQTPEFRFIEITCPL